MLALEWEAKLQTFPIFGASFSTQWYLVQSLGMSSDTVETPELAVEDVTSDTLSAKCILFNDEWHTFDEVIEQIMKATKCSREMAERHTVEVHIMGQSIVYSGNLARCLQVSTILEEIALRTNVEF